MNWNIVLNLIRKGVGWLLLILSLVLAGVGLVIGGMGGLIIYLSITIFPEDYL